MTKFSVLIITYNQEKYIQDCVNSVLNQTYQDFEILINDDCSTDSTYKKIEEINDSRIKIFKPEYNKGINAAIDCLVQNAAGEYTILLGGDDMIVPNYLETILNTFTQNPEIGAVYCNLTPINEENISYKNVPPKKYLTVNMPEHEQLRFAFLFGNFVFSTGMAVKTSCLKNILPLPYSIVNNQDFKMHIDLLVNNVKNIVLDDKLVLYRVFRDGTNISSKGFITELRESLEFEYVMDSFLKIKDIQFLEQIFEKEIKETGITPYPDTIPFFLGRMAILAKKDAKKSWGYHKIIEFMKTETGFNIIKERYGFTYKELLELTKQFKNTTFQRCYKYKKLFNASLIGLIIMTVISIISIVTAILL